VLAAFCAGNFANTLVILILMAIVGATGSVVSAHDAELTWRLQVSADLAAHQQGPQQPGCNVDFPGVYKKRLRCA
jgi:hypothetical protein